MNNKFPLVFKGRVKPAIKILTDYPRDDLASDEVHQALVTACAVENLDCHSMDVGAIPSMDTVVAGFKTAQLGMNSQMGYGHVIMANCAPRKNIITAKSKGEAVVIGMLDNGIAFLIVNSGYGLAPFMDLIKAGKACFFKSRVPDEGSQFRSRDFFPKATAHLARFLVDRLAELGEEKISKLLAEQNFSEILKTFDLLGEPLPLKEINELSQGSIWYIDNFGNIKLNLNHEELLKLHPAQTSVVLSVGDIVVDAVIGQAGFSQGEGILAVTKGSSGWQMQKGEEFRFAEIFLRGGSAENLLKGAYPGEQVLCVGKEDLRTAQEMIRDSGLTRIGPHHIGMLSEAKLMELFAYYGLIHDGFDTRPLQKSLKDSNLIDILKG